MSIGRRAPGGYSRFGTAAKRNTGTTAGRIPLLDSSARLPAVDGSLLTNVSASPSAFAGGRLAYVNATSIKFSPYNGDRIKINGTVYAIPSSGVSIANTSVNIDGTPGSNLAASTTYLVGLYDSGGTLTPYFASTLTHAPSTTAGNVGTEIVVGSDLITLVGLIRTNGSNQFVDGASQRFVASWLNRLPLVSKSNFTTDRTTTSTTYTEINTEIRTEYVAWAGWVEMALSGAGYVSNVGTLRTQLQIDGTAVGGYGSGTSAAAGYQFYIAVNCRASVTEGYHYGSMNGRVTSDTATWVGSGTAGNEQTVLETRLSQ